MVRSVRLTLAWLAVSLLLWGVAGAAEVSESWSGPFGGRTIDITATAVYPDQAEPGTDFEITVTASTTHYAYWESLCEDAEWNYVDEETAHRLNFTDPGTIHELDWQMRSPWSKTFTFNRPAGTYYFTFYVETFGPHHGGPGVAVDFEVVVADPCDFSVGGIDDLIQSLPDGAFKNNGKNRKKTFANKLGAVQKMIDEGRYEEAMDKLLNDIRAKLDGGDGNDWITDPDAAADLLDRIDTLVNCLWDAMTSPPGE